MDGSNKRELRSQTRQCKVRVNNARKCKVKINVARQYKVEAKNARKKSFKKQIVIINTMEESVSSQVKSLIKYELDIDEDRDHKTREPIVNHSCSRERAPSVDSAKISGVKLSNFSLNQDRTIKKEPIEIDDDPVAVYGNKENLVQTPKNTVLSEANDVSLSISSDNVLLEDNNGKDQVQGQQVPFNVAATASQVKTLVEHQKTCGVLCRDQLQTLNSPNRWSDTSKGQVIVLEPPIKRPKTELRLYEEFEAKTQTEKTTVDKLSLTSNDASLNYEISGSREGEVNSKQVLKGDIVDNLNNINNNIGKVQQNKATNSVKKVITLKILKLDKNKKIQPVYSDGNEEDEDSCEIIYEKSISNERNQNSFSCNFVIVNNLMKTPTQSTSAPVGVQPVKKVLLVQLDPKTVSEILTGSSSQVKLPIVNLQQNLTFGNRCNSGSKEADDNCAVESARMPMNLPTPQPDVSATTRSMEDPSTVCVPERETFPAVNAIGKSPFFFVDVDGS
ncbi:uncharacterized protein LOC141532534 [Cotesia typhae]|uniref:uncharacterized protein LOC141532534 n=1 Tax=Cotesia typhae TaxID=2053667 RepID=UPI003D689D9C